MNVVVLAVVVPDEDVRGVVEAECREVAAGCVVPLVHGERLARAQTEHGMEHRLLEPVAGHLPHLLGDLAGALVRAEGAADQHSLGRIEDVLEGTFEVGTLDDLVDHGASPRSCRRTWASRS